MPLFSSPYFVFLLVVFALFWLTSQIRLAYLAVLLTANYFFYAKWDLFYLALIPCASLCDYAIALALGQTERKTLRRLLICASALINLGILATFKYMPLVDQGWKWVFPLGISFYTFQSLSYTIDVFRKDAKPTPSLLAYLCAVSFFATTLSGPITRPAQLITQLERKGRQLTGAESGRAFYLIGLGLIKKLLIADYLGENLIKRVFDTPDLYSGFEVLIAVYAYALQLYYDFSGYTDIAMGSAMLLSIKLPSNFNQPYAAENIADFWRRWHISLSNWLRDYLYFSLPGLRSKWKIFAYVNLIITMVLGGLWHGASWNFALWGLLHGVALALTRAAQVARGNPKPSSAPWRKFGRTFVTVQFVCFAWIFFRAPNFETAAAILSRISSFTFSGVNISAPFLVVFLIAALAHYAPKRLYDYCSNIFVNAPAYAQAAAMALLVLAIQYVSTTGAAPFIYTRF